MGSGSFNSMRVLVLGGTGRLGRPVVEQLVVAGHRVRLLVRQSASPPTWLPADTELVVGDAVDRAAVAAAAVDCDAIHISVSGRPEMPAVRTALHAATANRVDLISYVSGSATFPEHRHHAVVATKLEAEQAIKASGIDHLIFCPSFAMEVLPMHVQRGLALYFGKQPFPFHWLAGTDFGAKVAAAYENPETRNDRWFIRGPEAISMPETLRRYCAVRHPDISRPYTVPFAFAAGVAKLTRDRDLATAVEVYRMYQSVSGDGGDPDPANELLGPATTTLEQWLDADRTP